MQAKVRDSAARQEACTVSDRAAQGLGGAAVCKEWYGEHSTCHPSERAMKGSIHMRADGSVFSNGPMTHIVNQGVYKILQ